MEVVEIGAPLSAESASPLFVTAPVLVSPFVMEQVQLTPVVEYQNLAPVVMYATPSAPTVFPTATVPIATQMVHGTKTSESLGTARTLEGFRDRSSSRHPSWRLLKLLCNTGNPLPVVECVEPALVVTYALDAPVVEYVTPELTVCFRGSCDHSDSGANSFPNSNSADRHRHVFAGDVRGVSDHVRGGPFVVKCFRVVCFDRVVCMRMARRSSACGWPGGRLHADGPEVVCMRMARRSSACGWPRGRLHADGPEVVCMRMARRSSADDRGGRPRMATRRPDWSTS